MNVMYLIILVLPFVVGIYTSYFNLRFNDRSLFFGVRLPIDFKITNEMENIKKQYKKNALIYQTIIFLITSCLFFIVPGEFSISVGIIGVMFYPLIGMVNFGIANSKIKKIKQRDKWTGYSKNIVVLDLDYRNNSESEKSISNKLLLIPIIITILTLIIGVYTYASTKNEMIPGVFGENGVVKEFVKRGDIVSIWQYISPVIVQIIFLIIIYLIYFMIIKSKQIINGGEVESLKIYNKKVKNATVYYIALISTITCMFFMGFFIWDKLNSTFAVITLMFILIISIIVYSVYYQKVIKQYRVNYNVKDGKMIINRDDDKNYIFGMIYNNPNDPSISIPKRIGTGYDFNYGNLKVRIVASIGGVLIALILIFTAFVLPFTLSDRIPEITRNQVKITGFYGTTIEKNNISDISMLKSLPTNLERSNGADFQTKLLGKFTENKTYKARLYISNVKGEVIRILNKDGTRVYINHETKESTEKLYKTLKNYIEVK